LIISDTAPGKWYETDTSAAKPCSALIVEALSAEVERVRNDKDFTARAKKLLERDKELLERLAR
jgi:hypothetical protein